MHSVPFQIKGGSAHSTHMCVRTSHRVPSLQSGSATQKFSPPIIISIFLDVAGNDTIKQIPRQIIVIKPYIFLKRKRDMIYS